MLDTVTLKPSCNHATGILKMVKAQIADCELLGVQNADGEVPQVCCDVQQLRQKIYKAGVVEVYHTTCSRSDVQEKYFWSMVSQSPG